MVFENLTLVELNLENARIGPRFGDDDDDGEEPAAAVAAEQADGSRLAPVVGFLLMLGLGAALAYWRSSGGEDLDGDGAEQISIESAAEQ